MALGGPNGESSDDTSTLVSTTILIAIACSPRQGLRPRLAHGIYLGVDLIQRQPIGAGRQGSLLHGHRSEIRASLPESLQ